MKTGACSGFAGWRCVASVAFALILSGVGTPLPGADFGPGKDWRFTNALPNGNNYNGGWVAGENDVFFGGDGGLIVRWNGTAMVQMPTPTTRDVKDIHGTSPTDVWAVGADAYTINNSDRSLLMHYDGSEWRLTTPPQDNYDQEGVYESVFAIAPNNVWAVASSPNQLSHWDGTRWEVADIPSAVRWEGGFRVVFATGPDNVFFGGTHGQLLRLSGGNWTMEQKTESGSWSSDLIESIWGLSPEVMYAGNSWGQVYRRNTDGTWASLGFPTNINEDNTVRHLWGRSANEIYIVGNFGVRKYDGVNPPVRTDFTSQMRRQIWAATGHGDKIYGMGPNGMLAEVALGSEGMTFSPLAAGGDLVFNYVVQGVLPCGDGILVHGTNHNAGDPIPLTYFDGSVPLPFPVKPPGMGDNVAIPAAVSNGPNDITIAWTNYMLTGAGVHRWNGETWTAVGGGSGAPYDVTGMWKSATGNLYVSRYQSFWKHDGTGWSMIADLMQPENPPMLGTVWGRSDNEVYVAADAGRIFRWNGTTLALEQTPGGDRVTSIGGDATNTYAVGFGGMACRRTTAGAWEQIQGATLRTGDDFGSIVTTQNGVHVSQQTNSGITGGGKGRVWKFTGNSAELVAQGFTLPLVIFGANQDGTLFGCNTQGGFGITTQPAPTNMTSRRMGLGSTAWQAFGYDGVAYQVAAPLTSRPMVSFWSRPHAPAYFQLSADTTKQAYPWEWVLVQDSFYMGTAMGPIRLRFPVTNPDDELYRNGGQGWQRVEATYDPVTRALITNDTMRASAWTVASSHPPITPPPPPEAWIIGQLLRGEQTATNDANADQVVDAADIITITSQK